MKARKEGSEFTVEFLEDTLNGAGAAAAAHANVEFVLMFGHFELLCGVCRGERF